MTIKRITDHDFVMLTAGLTNVARRLGLIDETMRFTVLPGSGDVRIELVADMRGMARVYGSDRDLWWPTDWDQVRTGVAGISDSYAPRGVTYDRGRGALDALNAVLAARSEVCA